MNKVSNSWLHLSDPMSSTPFGDIVSWMTVLPAVPLPCLSTRHCLSLVQCTPDTQVSLLFTQVFALKVTLEELLYTVVSKISLCITIICLVSACVCVCVCVCVQSPFKSLDGKRTLVTIFMSLAHKRLPGMC